MRYEKSCGTIIINNSKVLLIQQTGFYGFPKGHMEKGETEVETAIRETKEETNLDVKIDEELRFSLSYPKGENILKEVVYFMAEPLNPLDIKAKEDEIAEVMWVEKENVVKTLTFDNIKQLWKEVLKQIETK